MVLFEQSGGVTGVRRVNAETGRHTVPFAALNARAVPFEAKAVCDDSTETPNQSVLFQSWTNRSSRLPRPVEADDVLRVDRQRYVLGAWQYSELVRGQHAPRLTGQDVGVVIVVIVEQPRLAHAQSCSCCSHANSR